jgi:hypothetical protein
MLERLPWDKRSSLLQKSVNYDRKKSYNIDTWRGKPCRRNPCTDTAVHSRRRNALPRKTGLKQVIKQVLINLNGLRQALKGLGEILTVKAKSGFETGSG